MKTSTGKRRVRFHFVTPHHTSRMFSFDSLYEEVRMLSTFGGIVTVRVVGEPLSEEEKESLRGAWESGVREFISGVVHSNYTLSYKPGFELHKAAYLHVVDPKGKEIPGFSPKFDSVHRCGLCSSGARVLPGYSVVGPSVVPRLVDPPYGHPKFPGPVCAIDPFAPVVEMPVCERCLGWVGARIRTPPEKWSSEEVARLAKSLIPKSLRGKDDVITYPQSP